MNLNNKIKNGLVLQWAFWYLEDVNLVKWININFKRREIDLIFEIWKKKY